MGCSWEEVALQMRTLLQSLLPQRMAPCVLVQHAHVWLDNIVVFQSEKVPRHRRFTMRWFSLYPNRSFLSEMFLITNVVEIRFCILPARRSDRDLSFALFIVLAKGKPNSGKNAQPAISIRFPERITV